MINTYRKWHSQSDSHRCYHGTFSTAIRSNNHVQMWARMKLAVIISDKIFHFDRQYASYLKIITIKIYEI